MTQYIIYHKSRFWADGQVPYRNKLRQLGWYDFNGRLTTPDIDKVLPVAEHLDPRIKKALEANIAKQKKGVETEYVMHTPDGTTPYPHQNESARFMLDHKYTLLADDMGLGKTATIIATANDPVFRPKRWLLIVPASLKYNWWNELQHWLMYDPGQFGIVEGSVWADAPNIIINYDILSRHLDKLQNRVWDYLVCDEAHRLKNFEALRTRIVLGTKRANKDKNNKEYSPHGIRARKEVYATGTPMNRPIDLWPLLTRCDPKSLGKSYTSYTKRYCGAYYGTFGRVVTGASNLEELGTRLRTNFMVRHDISVLKLPPLIETPVITPPIKQIISAEQALINDNLEALQQLARAQGVVMPEEPETWDWVRLLGDTMAEKAKVLKSPDYKFLFEEMATIRKETGIAKIPHMIEYIEDQMEKGEPLVVFAYHKEVIKSLHKHFGPKWGKVVGGMSPKRKEETKQAFINGELDHIIGNLHAMSEGWTLTRSNHEIFCEVDYNATIMGQAKMRIHRISQGKTTFAEYLLADKTIDVNIFKTSLTKAVNIEKVFG